MHRTYKIKYLPKSTESTIPSLSPYSGTLFYLRRWQLLLSFAAALELLTWIFSCFSCSLLAPNHNCRSCLLGPAGSNRYRGTIYCITKLLHARTSPSQQWWPGPPRLDCVRCKEDTDSEKAIVAGRWKCQSKVWSKLAAEKANAKSSIIVFSNVTRTKARKYGVFLCANLFISGQNYTGLQSCPLGFFLVRTTIE